MRFGSVFGPLRMAVVSTNMSWHLRSGIVTSTRPVSIMNRAPIQPKVWSPVDLCHANGKPAAIPQWRAMARSCAALADVPRMVRLCCQHRSVISQWEARRRQWSAQARLKTCPRMWGHWRSQIPIPGRRRTCPRRPRPCTFAPAG
jgi:hypothetical protein